MTNPVRWILALAAVLCLPTVSVAQEKATNIPLRNWTVPPYIGDSARGGLSAMTDLPPAAGLGFVATEPCRLVDTRYFTGSYGPPSMAANATRSFDLNSAPHCPGFPANLRAYSLNFTIIFPSAAGDVRAWPTPNPPAVLTSIQNWQSPGVIIANAAIVAAGTGGSIDVHVAGASADLLIDVNGYFTSEYNSGVRFEATSSSPGQGAIFGTNTSSTAGSSGVHGLASATSGTVFGVFGKTSSSGLDAAGVKGVDGSGSPPNATSFQSAGVRGESAMAIGLLGISRDAAAVQGTLVHPTTGAALAEGKLGHLIGGTYYGVYAATGEIGGTGMKFFVIPHPTDPALVIRYVSLEGPEAGTYFRGRARLAGGAALIDVPESFRLATAEEALSVQLTPIGRPGTLWVEALNLNQIEIRGARDVEFFYTVNGVRSGHEQFQPVSEGAEFIPGSASVRLPEGLSPETKRRLIANGTYNSDGTVNLETAERLGWTRRWAARSRP